VAALMHGNTSMSSMPPMESLPDATTAFVGLSLTQAFACFSDAAKSLERSYHQLEGEVARLRRELEERNADLARSLQEKSRMQDVLRTILQGLPCGVVVIEPSGQITFLNPAGARILAVGRQVSHVSHLPPTLQAALTQVKEGNEWELELRDPAAKFAWLHLQHAVLGSSGDSVFILEDVSERKRFAQARQRMERDQALAEMAAVLAHEVRNPLGSLELFAGLLAESATEAEQRGWAEQVQAGLRMLAATVNNVLHFHHLPGPNLAPTDLGKVLTGVRDFLQPLARQANVAIELRHELQGIQIQADRHRLEQVLFNLAINSLRSISDRGTIALCGGVRWLKRSMVAEIQVIDDGPGLPVDTADRIFDAGFTTRPGSPGLGLTVCKLMVEQHRGTIKAANRPSGGACFTIQFPMGESA
jgi:two-component system sensor histidine kinase FlrB